jgi:hypothetical protein
MVKSRTAYNNGAFLIGLKREDLMNIKEITRIAKSRGIKPSKLNKSSLIRTIQLQEGNFDCFGSAYIGECNQHQCSWRNDCLGQER